MFSVRGVVKSSQCLKADMVLYWFVVTYLIDIVVKRLKVGVYVVWQKSNETDFLLTMNFILF